VRAGREVPKTTRSMKHWRPDAGRERPPRCGERLPGGLAVDTHCLERSGSVDRSAMGLTKTSSAVLARDHTWHSRGRSGRRQIHQATP